LIPESERPLDVCVIGLDPNKEAYFFLPDLIQKAGVPSAQINELKKQFYWLNFELSHGQIMNAIPTYTQVFIAVPDPDLVHESKGGEESLFKEYLMTRCGWPEERIKKSVHFFKTGESLVWSQDIGKILGKDTEGRWIIFRGQIDREPYRRAVDDLCRSFPDHFSFRDLPPNVSAEGGDEDLVRAPDGHLVFLVGRHRAVKYLELLNGKSFVGRSITLADIEEAQNAFSTAFEGVPVVFMTSSLLENPGLGNEEIFHLDMSVAVVGDGQVNHGFIPTFGTHPVDRMTSNGLDPNFVSSAQNEYDLMADELKGLGFPVERPILNDHPVRSPANLVRFYDPQTGRCTALLAHYPRQDTNGGGSQALITSRLEQIRKKYVVWGKNPDAVTYNSLFRAVQDLWNEMTAVSMESDPDFEATANLFRKAGIDVVPVADFAWGSGGLHCQLLH
jgi:hypothetical protein